MALALSSLLAAPGRAQGAPPTPTKTCDPSNPAHCSLPLLEGQKAPFGGILLTIELAAAVAAASQHNQKQLELETAHVRQTMELQLAAEQRLREAEERRAAALEAKLQEQPWYERPLGVAVVMVGGIIAATVVAKQL